MIYSPGGGPVVATNLTIVNRNANTRIEVLDSNSFFRASGTFTQTFSADVIADFGWWSYYQNVGTGRITLAGVASITSDRIVYPGECALMMSTGSAIEIAITTPFAFTLTASEQIEPQLGYLGYEGRLWGGGASGGKSSASAGGGGGGACVPFYLTTTQLNNSFQINIAASVNGTAAAGNGSNGHNSTITDFLGTFAFVTAFGGGAGGGDATNTTPFLGGSGGGAQSIGLAGTINGTAVRGGRPSADTTGWVAGTSLSADNAGYGGAGVIGSTGAHAAYGGGSGGAGNGLGGNSLYGGAGGGGGGSLSFAGGTSNYGGNGGAGSDNTVANDGAVPAGGGGGTRTGTSGKGAAGQCYIRGVV